MNINGTLKINSVTSGSTATEILVYNTGTTLVERRSTLPESSITFGTRFTNWNAYNSNGIVVQTSSTSWVPRTITGPAAGITITNGNGVSGNPTLDLSNDLAALEGLASTGFAVRTATDTWTQRTITGTVGQITVTNGNGVSGNPVLALDSTFVSNSSLWKLSGTGTFNVQSTSGFSSITSTGGDNFCFGGVSGNPNTISSTGYANSILGGYDNTISGSGAADCSSIIGGYANNITSYNNIISGGTVNSITGGGGNGITGGVGNSITDGSNNVITGGSNNTITGDGNNTILSGGSNTILANSYNSIIGGNNTTLSSLVNNSTAINIVGQTLTLSNMVYVPNLNINTVPTTSNNASALLVRNTTTGTVEVRNTQTLSRDIFIQFAGSWAPVDAQTVGFGQLPVVPINSTLGGNPYRIVMRGSGTIRVCQFYLYAGATVGTAEAWTLRIRVNNTTNYTVATVAVANAERIFSNTALNIPFVDGDVIRMELINPTWVTNPTACTGAGYLQIY